MRGPFCARPAISFSMREVDEAVFFSSQCVERTRFWMASERADCFFGAMRLPTLGLACVDDLPLAGVGRLSGLKPWVMAAPGTNGPKTRHLFFWPRFSTHFGMFHLLQAGLERVLAPDHYGTLIGGFVLLLLIHTWAKGPSLLAREERLEAQEQRAHERHPDAQPSTPPRLRDMAGRVVLIGTGGMTPIGVVVIAMLANQGAHVVVLVPDLAADDVVQMILLLRESTRNENIFAESCDIADMHSISSFSQRWFEGKRTYGLAGTPMSETHRLDAVVFLPTQQGTTPIGVSRDESYTYHVLGPFHLLSTLLPSLQRQPPSRDVRIVSAISPWYAAGLGRFGTIQQPYTKPIFEPWTFLGASAMHELILAREWQRKLDAMAASDARPPTKLPGIDDQVPRLPRSHISSVLVCPGFDLASQLSAFFSTAQVSSTAHAIALWVVWLLVYPLLWVVGRPTHMAAEAVVWAICTRLAKESSTGGIRPGQLYREGRLLVPEEPRSCRGASGAAALWTSTEAAVQARLTAAPKTH